ncbi:DUF4252 domain-containing protein [Maribellus comscasis]|uniref:DUF4252 domain-containing protein n=1 Tax=Maribellus comscasis TaxID=2681766 RepID=A0A6I6K008_9BACT|nr:DUF4252 domain-containing protein [Maribellus comscasis]QGY46909.1 DUF4252 domain-containing protein [Maribellus comscasis]
MKRNIFFIFAALLILSSCSGYDPGVSEAFMKYRLKEGVTTITVPGWVIRMASRFGDLDKEEREILQSIDKVRVLTVENEDLNARINLHEEFYNGINRKRDYEELLVIHENDEDVTIFGKMDDNVIKEMVILVGGDDNVLVYLKGEIKPELLDDKIDLSHPDKFLSLDF